MKIACSQFCFLLLVVGALLLPANSAAEPESLKIGAMLCLSGECAEWGSNSLKGLQLAAKEINDQGGVLGKNIELLVQDSRDESPSQAVSAYRQLTADSSVRFLVGTTWSVGGLPVAPIAKRGKVLLTSPSIGVREFNETSDNIFNVWPHDEIGTRLLANYAVKQGWKRAAIFSVQDPWAITQGTVFEEEVGKLGGSVTLKVEPLGETPSLKTEALSLINTKPDVIFMTNFNHMARAAKELRKLKYKGPILAILMDKSTLKAADGALEGAVFALYPEASKSFTETFRRTYGEKPGITADTAYDVLKLYAKSITEAGTTEVDAVKKIFASVRDYQGASGTISFDENGGVLKTPLLWRVKGMEYEQVDK